MRSFLRQAASQMNEKQSGTESSFTITAGTENLSPTSRVSENASGSPDLWEFTPVSRQFPKCPLWRTENDKGGSHFTCYVYGSIVEPQAYTNLVATLRAMGEKDSIDIYIDSPGGYLLSGANVSSAIEACKGHTKTISCGLCASAGSLKWSAGKECVITNFGQNMYHMSSHMDMGNSIRIGENAHRMVSYVETKCLAVALKKNHITQDEFDKITKQYGEAWITASQMRERLSTTTEAEGTQAGTENLTVFNKLNKDSLFLDTPSKVAQLAQTKQISVELSNELLSTMSDEDIYTELLSAQFNGGTQADPKGIFKYYVVGEKRYHIFFDCMQNYYDPMWCIGFSKLLDSFTEEDTLLIDIVGDIPHYFLPFMGNIFSALERTNAKTIGILNGPSTFIDIAFWLFCKERQLGNYAKLTLNAEILDVPDVVEFRRNYIKAIVQKAVDLELITSDQMNSFLNDKKSIDI